MRESKKIQKKLTRKSKIFAWVLRLLFRSSGTELIAFVLDAYSDGLKSQKGFDYSNYLTLKQKIKVVAK